MSSISERLWHYHCIVKWNTHHVLKQNQTRFFIIEITRSSSVLSSVSHISHFPRLMQICVQYGIDWYSCMWAYRQMSSIVEEHTCSAGVSVHMSVCKKCIMFIILCPLFVGKLRALMSTINPNEQAVSRIYGGSDIWSLTALISALCTRWHTAAPDRTINTHAAADLLGYYHSLRHHIMTKYICIEIIEFHILCKHTLTCTQWPTKEFL